MQLGGALRAHHDEVERLPGALESMLPAYLEAVSAVAAFDVSPEKSAQAFVAALEWEACTALPAAVPVIMREAHELLALTAQLPVSGAALQVQYIRFEYSYEYICGPLGQCVGLWAWNYW